jgi:hypothetical protein
MANKKDDDTAVIIAIAIALLLWLLSKLPPFIPIPFGGGGGKKKDDDPPPPPPGKPTDDPIVDPIPPPPKLDPFVPPKDDPVHDPIPPPPPPPPPDPGKTNHPIWLPFIPPYFERKPVTPFNPQPQPIYTKKPDPIFKPVQKPIQTFDPFGDFYRTFERGWNRQSDPAKIVLGGAIAAPFVVGALAVAPLTTIIVGGGSLFGRAAIPAGAKTALPGKTYKEIVSKDGKHKTVVVIKPKVYREIVTKKHKTVVEVKPKTYRQMKTARERIQFLKNLKKRR